MRIAYYGGSYNPPHVGHQLTISYVLATQKVDQVIVSPVFMHPDDKPLEDFEHRVVMCNQMVKIFDERKVSVRTVEKSVYDRHNSNLTIWTARYLLESAFADQILLILGSDILPNFEKWEGYSELAKLRREGKIDFYFMGRAGHGNSPVEMPRISSTEIRQMLLGSGAMNEGMLAGMLPQGVYEYIKNNKLYGL